MIVQSSPLVCLYLTSLWFMLNILTDNDQLQAVNKNIDK